VLKAALVGHLGLPADGIERLVPLEELFRPT